MEKELLLLAEINNNDLNKNTEEKANSSEDNKNEKNNTIKGVTEMDKIEGTKFIEFTDFTKVEMKIGNIKNCEKVEGSEKLLMSQIDVAGQLRQVVSGIALYYSPGDLIGKNVVLVTNLKPRKIMGKESQGMILCAQAPNGDLKILTVEGEIETGSEVG